MRLLDEILKANREFTMINKGTFPPLKKSPQKQVAIFTCMDTRLVHFLEPAMGLSRGDAKIIKNAGNTVIDPQGGVIRSLVVAIYLLGVEEILVIGHKDCGMANLDIELLKQKMLDRGIKEEDINSIKDLKKWVGAFTDPVKNIEEVTSIIRNSPLIPKDVPVHGLLFDPNDGHLDVVVNGYVVPV